MVANPRFVDLNHLAHRLHTILVTHRLLLHLEEAANPESVKDTVRYQRLLPSGVCQLQYRYSLWIGSSSQWCDFRNRNEFQLSQSPGTRVIKGRCSPRNGEFSP